VAGPLNQAFSLPGIFSFTVSHPTSTRPLVYVQLAPGEYPSQLSRILLQRIEGEAVWVAGSISATSRQVRSNTRGLTFWDNTSRDESWGEWPACT
jgi:hypothetical protein